MVLRPADRRHPALHRAGVRRAPSSVHREHPVAGAAGQHAAARHPRHRAASRRMPRPGTVPVAVGLIDDAAGPARSCSRATSSALVGADGESAARRFRGCTDRAGGARSASPSTASSSRCAARTGARRPAACGGCTSTTRPSCSCASPRTTALVLASKGGAGCRAARPGRCSRGRLAPSRCFGGCPARRRGRRFGAAVGPTARRSRSGCFRVAVHRRLAEQGFGRTRLSDSRSLAGGLTACVSATGSSGSCCWAPRRTRPESGATSGRITTSSRWRRPGAAPSCAPDLVGWPDQERLVLTARRGRSGSSRVYDDASRVRVRVLGCGRAVARRRRRHGGRRRRGGHDGDAARRVARRVRPATGSIRANDVRLVLVKLLIGVGRVRRGELLNGGQFVRSVGGAAAWCERPPGGTGAIHVTARQADRSGAPLRAGLPRLGRSHRTRRRAVRSRSRLGQLFGLTRRYPRARVEGVPARAAADVGRGAARVS